MEQKILQSLKKHQILLLTLIAGAFGVAVFIYIYGTEILDFTNDSWLFSAEDLTQHYGGWVFYRKAAWVFPLGLFNTLSYPDYASIVFTDSIPLFAVIFKLASNILPETFQYFGLFGMLCYMLQGIFAFTLLRKFIKNKTTCMIGTIFFVISPCIIQRMFIHTALSAHFLLLMGLCIFAYRDKYKNKPKTKIILWTLLFVLCISIHMYYIPIVVIIALGTFISEYLEDKKTWKTSILTFIISCIMALILLYILGGFGNEVYVNDGISYYNANLNIFLNSQGYSKFMKRLPMATEGEFEAFGYLGLGIIFMVLIGSICYITRHYKNIELKEMLKKPNIAGVLICAIFGVILSLGTSIKIGGHILFNIPYPSFIITLIAMFRATGRFIILPYYIIFWASIYLIDKACKGEDRIKTKANAIILICLIIQLIDIIPVMQNRVNYNKEIYEFDKIAWEEALDGYNHITYLSNPYYVKKDTFRLAYIASKNNCTLNDYYFARKVKGKEEETIKVLEEILEDMKKEELNTIYIIRKEDLPEKFVNKIKKQLEGFYIL